MKSAVLKNTSKRHFIQTLGVLGTAAWLGWTNQAKAQNKQRIVSIGSAVTEIIYALKAQQDIIAVDTTSIYPAEAARLPQIGYARTLSAESILSLAPTRVIATEEAGPPAVIRQLTASGIPVSVLDAHFTYEGMIARIKTLSSLIQRESQGEQLIQSLNTQWAQTQKAVNDRKTKPRVLFVLSHSPNMIMVAGKNTGAEAMIRYANGINAIADFSGYKTLTPEAVIAAQPDIVLFTTQGIDAIGGMANALNIPGILRTSAGQHKRIISLDAVYLLGFGPRMPDAVEDLHQEIVKVMPA